MKKETKQSKKFIRSEIAKLLGSAGGKARAKKYTKEELSAMGKKGGRPILNEYQIKDNDFGIHEIHKAGCKDLKNDACQVSSIIKAKTPEEVFQIDKFEYETSRDYKIMPCAH